MQIKLETTLRAAFGTSRLVDGAATDADALPTCVVLEQGTALGYAPVVTNKAVGLYEVAIAATAANGFEVGKEYTAYVTVIMGGVTARDALTSFKVFTNDIDDAGGGGGDATAANQATIIGHVDSVEATLAAILGHVDTEVAAIKAKTDNLPADPAGMAALAAAHGAGSWEGDAATLAAAVWNALLTDHTIVGSTADALAVAAGLLQGNFFMDQVNNTDPNGQTSARIRVFRTGAAAAAATANSEGEGAFAVFTVTTTYEGPNQIATHRTVRT